MLKILKLNLTFVAAIIAMPLAGPLLGQDLAPPQLKTEDLPAARGPTSGERGIIPPLPTAEDRERSMSLANALRDGPPLPPPPPPPAVKWSSAVPPANRVLERCIFARTDWNADIRAVTGVLDNVCNMSLRIHGSYGLYMPKGRCIEAGRIDGVLLPPLGRKKITWNGSDNRAQKACIVSIELLGVPQWSVTAARAARAWLLSEASGRHLTSIMALSHGEHKVQSGPVNSATSNDLCVLTLTSSSFGPYGGPMKSYTLAIRWSAVAGVEDVGYNGFTRVHFEDGNGNSMWDIQFDNFGSSLASTGYDPTVAATVLSEYCRAADAP